MKVKTAFRLGLVSVLILFMAGCSSPEQKKGEFFGRGMAFYESGDFVKARLDFKNAIQLDPRFHRAHYMLGLTELALKNHEKAYKSFTRAAELSPDNLDVQIQLAKLLLGGRAPDKALEKVEMVLQREPANQEALMIKASALLARGEAGPSATLLEELMDRGCLLYTSDAADE